MARLIGRYRMGGGRIRDRVQSLIYRAPQFLLYVRVDPDRRCSCYDSYAADRSRWHEACLGTSYEVRLEVVVGRRQARPTEERDLGLFGQVSQTHPIVYFPAWVAPKENDLVVEVLEWSRDWRPLSVFRVYTVMISLPFSESEVSYYACGCNPYDVDLRRIVSALRDRQIVVPDVVARLARRSDLLVGGFLS